MKPGCIAGPRYECEYPFTGYYTFTLNRGRRSVIIHGFKEKRIKINYSKYLMCVKEKRILDPYEHVHHIDEDKTNDTIDNLEILLHPNHSKIHSPDFGMMNIICAGCGIGFEIKVSKYRDRIKRSLNLHCSAECFHNSRGIHHKEIFRKIKLPSLNKTTTNTKTRRKKIYVSFKSKASGQ